MLTLEKLARLQVAFELQENAERTMIFLTLEGEEQDVRYNRPGYRTDSAHNPSRKC